jgi:imidazolonepropionase-like amidohydrolase
MYLGLRVRAGVCKRLGKNLILFISLTRTGIKPMSNMIQCLHAGYLIDGTGNPIQKNVVLFVKNNRIIGIEPFHETLKNKITHNLSNHTIFPFLADAHVHLAMSGTLDLQTRREQLSMSFNQAKNQISNHLDQYAKAGIIVVRDGGDHFGHTFQYKKRFNHVVDILSPKMAWYRSNRYGQFAGKSIEQNTNCCEIISAQHEGSHIKIIQSGINSVRQFGKETKPQFFQDELTSICKWADQQNIPVMVHANGIQPVAIAINAGCTSIEHGYFMGDHNLKKMAEKQIYWVPTLIPMYVLAQNLNTSEERDIALRTFDSQYEQLVKAKEWGVPIVIGSDAGSFGVNHVQGLFDEMNMMRSCGLSLSQIIRSCTALSMSLFYRSNCGILQKGDLAKLVAMASRSIHSNGFALMDIVCYHSFE